MLRLGAVWPHGFGKAPVLEEGRVLVGVQVMEADPVAVGQVMEADPAVEVQAVIPDG